LYNKTLLREQIKHGMRRMKTFYILVFSLLFTFLFLGISYQVVADFWSSTYDEQNNNCQQMSYTLGRFLQGFGLPVKIMYGYHEDANGTITDAHVWVLVADHLQIDSVNLQVCDNTRYYSHYFIEDIEDAALRTRMNVDIS
jgi:hypothetical protein